ncbi:hypothetical protein BCV72DRAFT_204749 [Rhizopus microsporus var. microsporus]|uniref:Uncharacterized protein n=1 Tax=Rhizopus microsporus var. microsporus TaxID=86635 RepID=A0A1X0R7A7_RHIZD|nr:hypothetical protein BCV72DRAFT_204749 [Rhizopus microsporus var. microsporus]
MWRPRSNINTLQTRGAHFKLDNDANLTGITLFIRAPKKERSAETIGHGHLIPKANVSCIYSLSPWKKQDIDNQSF